MRETREGLEFLSSQPVDSSRDILERYFRFDNDDTKTLYEELSNYDPMMGQLVQEYYGTRILRQEPWECLVAYISSANNNISQISRIVEKLSDCFGETVNLDGETRCAFPTPERILEAGLPRIRALNLGLKRADSISWVAREVYTGSLDLNKLIGVPYQEAKQLLMECPGIGEKIADCVCLFSLDKLEAFPIDRHIGRALVKYCFPNLTETQFSALQDASRNRFGKYAGLAGQFLFQEIRSSGHLNKGESIEPYYF